MNVTQSQLYNPSDPDAADNSYRVEVNDSDEDWRLYIFQNESEVVVHSGNPGTKSDMSTLLNHEDTCREDAEHAVINFRNESLAGESCDALNFSDNLEGSIDISFNNSESVSGTYTLVVNGTDAAEKTHFDDPNNGNPTAQSIVYSVSYASHYEKADMTYERRGTYPVREETYAS